MQQEKCNTQSLIATFKTSKLRRFKLRRAASAFAIIVIAALLVEAMSLAQYHYARNLVEEGLENRAMNGLTLKAVRVKSILKSHERIVNNYVWVIRQNLNRPDSIFGIMRNLVQYNKYATNSFMAFVPGYYHHNGELFEPCAYRKGDEIVTAQIANGAHDYTQNSFYKLAIDEDSAFWSDPYPDPNAVGGQVVTFTKPITDDAGKTIGVLGLDVSTKGIIDTLNMRLSDPSTFFLLLTEDGQPISRPDTHHAKLQDVDNVVKLVNDSTHAHAHDTCDGSIIKFKGSNGETGYIFHAFMIGKPHWQVVMVCYDDEIYGKLNTMRRNFLLMLLAGLSFIGFVLYRFNRNEQRLHEAGLSKERTDSELRVAQGIQAEMLPGEAIARDDVDVAGQLVTAMEVGGDLYDYFIRDEKLYFCIGDVSGKGVPASLVMAVTHSQFRSFTRHESNPARIMQAINAASCEGNNTNNMFVTMFIGVLDLPTGRLRYCNAGHDAPLLIGDRIEPLPVQAHLPISVTDDITYSQQETLLPDNATLFLYTDGLTEASNQENKLFGLPRVIEEAGECLKGNRLSPKALMGAMQEAAARFVDGANQSDDLTMLAVNYHKPHEQVVLHDTLSLSNDVRQVPALNRFVQSVAERLGIDAPTTSQLTLAVEEAVVNVISYAYPKGTSGDITVCAQGGQQSLKFIITDRGTPFDPTQKADADTTLSAEERPIGGLGILLTHTLMDTVNYERVDGQNVLTLKKNITNYQIINSQNQ